MSSIIDALKKSDNNRTDESSANVNQIKFGNQPPSKSRRGFWLLVALLLLVAVAVFAWSRGWHHSAMAVAKGWFSEEPTNTMQRSQDAVEPASDATAATTQANKLKPPKPTDVKAKSLAVEQTKEASENDLLPEPDTNSGLDGKARSKEFMNNADELTVEEKSITVEPLNTDKKVTENFELTKQQNRKDIEPTLKQDYLLIHQIDFEVRKNIPPIKLNIHIYDPEPENRMVILNGVKYVIGESIEELITVKEINQQGVVLEFEGIRFLVPK